MIIQCPHCQTKYQVHENLMGKSNKCKRCSHTFIISSDKLKNSFTDEQYQEHSMTSKIKSEREKFDVSSEDNEIDTVGVLFDVFFRRSQISDKQAKMWDKKTKKEAKEFAKKLFSCIYLRSRTLEKEIGEFTEDELAYSCEFFFKNTPDEGLRVCIEITTSIEPLIQSVEINQPELKILSWYATVRGVLIREGLRRKLNDITSEKGEPSEVDVSTMGYTYGTGGRFSVADLSKDGKVDRMCWFFSSKELAKKMYPRFIKEIPELANSTIIPYNLNEMLRMAKEHNLKIFSMNPLDSSAKPKGSGHTKKINVIGLLLLIAFVVSTALSVIIYFKYLIPSKIVDKVPIIESSIEFIDVPFWVSEELKENIYANIGNKIEFIENNLTKTPWLKEANVQVTPDSVLITGK